MENSKSDFSELVVRKAEQDEAPLVAEIVTDAFVGDPVSSWISTKDDFFGWAWPLFVPFVLPHDEVYLAGDGLGAALWMPPGAKMDIKMGPGVCWTCLRRFGLKSMYRLFKMIIPLEKHHPKEPHFYLFVVGVRDAVKGRGIGSALLETVLKECDRRGILAYLENSNPRNLPFYTRHGFEVRKELTLSRTGPKMWLMYREPKVK